MLKTFQEADLEAIHGGDPGDDATKMWVMKLNEDDPVFEGKSSFYENNNWQATRPICFQSGCTTVDEKLCQFPFKFKGRLYDTCVTLEAENPWCSLKTDLNNNHIDGEENIGICKDTCPIQNCPIGFFYLTGDCYHLSGRKEYDTVSSVEEAENICLSYGSRLYQPRDYALDEELMKWEEDFLKSGNIHFEFDTWYLPENKDDKNSFILLGAFSLDILGSKKVQYNDLTQAYYMESLIEDQGSITSTTISDLATHSGKVCLMLDKDGKIVAEMCDGFNDVNIAGYICEARIIHTIGETGKLCQLPFTLDGSVKYHSCVYNETERYSWCPTSTNETGFGIDEEPCPDEREIAYKGPGSGKMCRFPFVWDRVWYDTCAYDP